MIDAHCHVPAAGPIHADGVERIVLNGTHPDDWSRVLGLAATDGRITPFLGLHPWHVHRAPPGWLALLRELLTAHPDAGVGECGLDRAARGIAAIGDQDAAFVAQVDLASELARPLVVHCVRMPGRVEALLRARPTLAARTLLHAYGGPLELVPVFAALGCTFSFVSWNPSPRWPAVVSAVHPDRLLVETDGFGCDPTRLRRAYEAVAAACDTPIVDLERTTRTALATWLDGR